MHIIVGLATLVLGLLYFALRANNTVKAVKELDHDTRGLQRRVAWGFENLFGSRLERVSDPTLAAVILMIQLVRTGSPVTAQEKTKIMELMEHPLGVRDISGVFERAWTYTQARLPFSNVADQLAPMLRAKLDYSASLELIDMLSKVAEAWNGASDLQMEAIARLRKRLMMG